MFKQNHDTMLRSLSFLLLLVISATVFQACDTLLGRGHNHIDAFGYELVQDGHVILAAMPAAGFDFNPSGQWDAYFEVIEGTERFVLSDAVLDEDGFSISPITIHFLDDRGQRIEVEEFRDFGGKGEHRLAWNGSASSPFQLPNSNVRISRYANDTWKVRFEVTALPEEGFAGPAGLQLELWHVDHSDYTAPVLDVYVMAAER